MRWHFHCHSVLKSKIEPNPLNFAGPFCQKYPYNANINLSTSFLLVQFMCVRDAWKLQHKNRPSCSWVSLWDCGLHYFQLNSHTVFNFTVPSQMEQLYWDLLGTLFPISRIVAGTHSQLLTKDWNTLFYILYRLELLAPIIEPSKKCIK